MTRDEAIERLNIHKSTSVFVDSIAEAIDMAIEVLSAEEAVWNEYEAEFTDLPDIPRYYYEKVVGKMAHEINVLKEQLESADAVQGANLINRHDAVTVIREECRKCNNMINDDLFMRIMSLPTSQQTDCTDFIMWLIEIVLDDEDWELNAVGYGEIIARKLKKLGLLEVKDGYYHRIFDENVWVVRCKDCEYADFNSPYPVCNFLEMNICENGYCSWARMKGGDE